MPETAEETAAREAAEAAAAAEAAEAAARQAAEDEVFDKERAMALITKLREGEKEGAKARRELAAAQARLKELEDAAKSEDDLKAERLATLEANQAKWDEEKKTLNLRLAVYSISGKLGVADSDLALAALDRSLVEYGEDGKPTNIEDVLTALLEAKPLLKGTPTVATPAPDINAGGGTGSGKKPTLTADELDMARRMGMTVEEYASFKGKRSIDDLSAAEKAAGATAT